MTKKLLMSAALALTLVGCTTTPRVITRTETVEVPIATPVPCLTEEQADEIRAQRPTNVATEAQPTTLTGVVGLLRAKLKEWEEVFAPTVDETLTACSTLDEPPVG